MSKYPNNVGKTFIYNIIIDDFLPMLSPPAYIVLTVICRKTIGWVKDKRRKERKLTDKISYTQFIEATPYTHADTIRVAVKELLGLELITVEGGARKIKQYGLNIKHIQKLICEANGIDYDPDLEDKIRKDLGLC